MNTTYVAGKINATRSTIVVESVYRSAKRARAEGAIAVIGRAGAGRHPVVGDTLGIYVEGRQEYAVRPA